jgi:hypothetical protein
MIRSKRSICPYPGLSFMALAERASYESPDEKTKKNHLCLRFHSKSNHLNPGLSPHGARRESVTSLSEKSRLISDLSRQI